MYHQLHKYFLVPDGEGFFHLCNPDGTPNCGNNINGALSHSININPGEVPSISIEYPLFVVKDQNEMKEILSNT